MIVVQVELIVELLTIGSEQNNLFTTRMKGECMDRYADEPKFVKCSVGLS